ncbi:MAG: beta-N-acetylhexosaminidase [Draconibacterium sp.]
MRKHKITFAFLFLVILSISSLAQIQVIPCTQQMSLENGKFVLSSKTVIVSKQSTQKEAVYLANILYASFGQKPAIQSKGKGIELRLNKQLKNSIGEEGYFLKVHPQGIVIEGATNTGIFYGIQTLRQLLPFDFEFFPSIQKTTALQCLSIKDWPRFQWRAFMLDESRHFKGVEIVKSLLDQMALLKMNVFHWHLTDDQGWRIEIKKFPKLTSVGAYRKDTQTVKHGDEREGIPHSGFYTQEQIKEIIEYATERHIEIVPEIEMPGHAMAAIAAYPWLGVLGTTIEVPVTFGKMDDSFNISDPKVIRFLKDVLEEVFALFPGKVVHIGGDEVKFETWKDSPQISTYMEKNGLVSTADLQIYFTNGMSQFIDSTGHRMMGWNEILGDNIHDWQKAEDTQAKESLAKSAIIHFWKGNLELINKAVSNGYDVVNSYHAQTYLDYNYTTIPVSKAYSFDPIPEGLDPKYNSHILGLGCQMWSEWILSKERMEAQIFPRLAAYAEVGWTNKNRKNYDLFKESLSKLKKRWKLLGINYFED